MIPLEYFLAEYYLEPVLNTIQFYRFTTRTIESFNSKHSIEKKIIRDVELTYMGKRKGLFVFHLLTTKVALNSNRGIRNAKLLKEDFFAFGNIVIGVNEKGEIVKIYNLKEMQDRWEKSKRELRKDYMGYEFNVFVTDISNVLRNEEKTLLFLNSKKMFGLYFHGLFGKNDIKEVPKKRTAAILDFDSDVVTEEIWTDNRDPKFIITAQKNNDVDKRIISNNKEIKKYEGELVYNKENQLQKGFLEIAKENMDIKYDILWVG
jgi:hypothetical protein